MRLKLCYRCRQAIPIHQAQAHMRRCRDRESERTQHVGSAEWKSTRAEIRRRDGGVCRASRLAALVDVTIASSLRALPCDGPLTCAHLGGNWRDDDPAGLLTLCERHHKAYDAARARQS